MEHFVNIKEKADYCLSCIKKPCAQTCPLNNDTQGFIKLIKEEKYKQAYELLCQTTVLQPICGEICPHAKQCQKACIRGIKGESVNIGELESFVGNLAIQNNWEIPCNEEEQMIKQAKVAVVGGGPAGLTCAAFLAKKGIKVTIYEKHEKLGGILAYGIPEFRLKQEVVEATIEKILKLGINVKTNQQLVKSKQEEILNLDKNGQAIKEYITLQELKNQYDAIFLAFGANIPSQMGIEGENLKGVYGGNSLLENNNHPNYEGKDVAVIGGGNVAMDTARSIKRLGAKSVKVIYRRAEEQMPAEKKEIEEAKAEGIEFLFKTNILKILGNSKVEKIECIKTELKQKEGETRLSPVNIENSNYLMNIDYVIMAVGSNPEIKLTTNLNLKTDNKGRIEINENNQTSNSKIFAGGDLVGENATVAWAARSGRHGAENIIAFLIDNKKCY